MYNVSKSLCTMFQNLHVQCFKISMYKVSKSLCTKLTSVLAEYYLYYNLPVGMFIKVGVRDKSKQLITQKPTKKEVSYTIEQLTIRH